MTATAFAVFKIVPADAYGAPTYFELVAGPYLKAGKAARALAGRRRRDPVATYYRAPVTFAEPATSNTNHWNQDGPAF
jgi:hypothetical protein